MVLDDRVNQAWNGPDPNAVQPDIGGTYHLSFHGQATVAAAGVAPDFTVQNQVYNPTTNVTTADLVVPHNVELFLSSTFTNTKNPESATGAGISERPADPARLRGEHDPALHQRLPQRPQAVRDAPIPRHRPGQRLSDRRTNNDAPLNWSQRRLPDEASQTDTSYASRRVLGIHGRAGQRNEHGHVDQRSPARRPTITSPSSPSSSRTATPSAASPTPG